MVAERLPAAETVHLSYGDEQPAEYVRQLAADHLVHAWDLAAATGGDRTLDPELVDEVAAWFAEREELYRAGGAVGAAGRRRPATRRPSCWRRAGRDAAWTPPQP